MTELMKVQVKGSRCYHLAPLTNAIVVNPNVARLQTLTVCGAVVLGPMPLSWQRDRNLCRRCSMTVRQQARRGGDDAQISRRSRAVAGRGDGAVGGRGVRGSGTALRAVPQLDLHPLCEPVAALRDPAVAALRLTAGQRLMIEHDRRADLERVGRRGV